jgi:hypothetical protein
MPNRQGAMRPLRIIVLLPGGDDLSGMGQTGEPVQVEAFITKLEYSRKDRQHFPSRASARGGRAAR